MAGPPGVMIWVVNPKIGVVLNPPNHPFVHRDFFLIFTIHFGVPFFLETPICLIAGQK